MSMRPSAHLRVWTALAAAGLVLAGCGSSPSRTSGSGSPTTAPSTTAGSSGANAVDTSASAKYGTILVTGSGRTLYMLTADTSSSSACTGACPPVWPPLLVTGSPKAGPGVQSALLSTIKRGDGSRQVTYNGHPLYTFASDAAAGQVNGEGINHFGGTWYVLDAAGQPVTSPSSSASSTTSTGGYRY